MNSSLESIASQVHLGVSLTNGVWLWVLAPLFLALLYLAGIVFEELGHVFALDVVMFAVAFYTIVSLVAFGEMRRAEAKLSSLTISSIGFLLICLFFIPILDSIRLNVTNGNFMFGFVPWADAATYIHGGWQMLVDGTLTEFHQRRPINASTMELRLLLAGFELHFLLFWNAVLIGLSTVYVFSELERHVGRLAALLFTIALFGYTQPYLPSTLSEILGLALGLLAFGALLRAVRVNSVSLFVLGLALLSFALNARAGAYFMLPAVWLWGVIYLPTTFRQRALVSLIGILAVLSGFIYSLLLIKIFGSGDVLTYNANFGDTFYGLARGGKSWHLASQEHPELYTDAGAAKRAGALFQLGFLEIAHHPFRFARVLLDELGAAIPFLLAGPRLRVFDGHQPTTWFAPVFVTLNLIGMGGLLRFGLDRRNALILLALVGVLASTPFILQDGGPRVFSPAMPFIFFVSAIGTRLAGKFFESGDWLDLRSTLRIVPETGKGSGYLSVIPSATLLILALTPFILGGTLNQYRSVDNPEPVPLCPIGSDYLRVDRSRLLYIQRVHAGNGQIHNSLSDVTWGELQSTLSAGSSMHIQKMYRAFKGPYTIFGIMGEIQNRGAPDNPPIITVVWPNKLKTFVGGDVWNLCVSEIPTELRERVDGYVYSVVKSL